MRKALLVLALVAASFAGGAFINGPGLVWLRTSLGLSMLEVEVPREGKSKPASPAPQSLDPEPPAAFRRPAPPLRAEKSPPTSTFTPPALEPPVSAREKPTEQPKRDPEVVRSLGEKTQAAVAQSAAEQSPPAQVRPASVGSWADTVARMQTLGVGRYWIEGEPGQTVRFRCIVPIVGRNAVAQLFEAEAADIQAAAELVLRHITLWKAAGGDK